MRNLLLLLALLLCGFGPFMRPDPLNEKGRKAYIAEDYAQAAALFAEAASSPALAENHQILLNLGASLQQAGQFEQAVQAYSAALAAPDNELRAMAYYNLGTAQLAGKQLKEAAESFTKSLALDPTNLSAKYNLEYVLRLIDIQQQNQCDNPQQQQSDDQQQSDQQQQQEDQQQDSEQQQQQNADQQQEEQQQQSAEQQEQERDQEEIDNILGSLSDREEEPLNLKMLKLRNRNARPDKDW